MSGLQAHGPVLVTPRLVTVFWYDDKPLVSCFLVLVWLFPWSLSSYEPRLLRPHAVSLFAGPRETKISRHPATFSRV